MNLPLCRILNSQNQFLRNVCTDFFPFWEMKFRDNYNNYSSFQWSWEHRAPIINGKRRSGVSTNFYLLYCKCIYIANVFRLRRKKLWPRPPCNRKYMYRKWLRCRRRLPQFGSIDAGSENKNVNLPQRLTNAKQM